MKSGSVKFVLAARNSGLEDLKIEFCMRNSLKPGGINTAVADVTDYESLLQLAKR